MGESAMTKRPLFFSFTAVLMLSACQPADKPAGNATEASGVAAVDPAAEEQAIRGQVDRWTQLIKAKDAKAIAALYAENGAVMPPNTPIGKGHEAIEKIWGGLLQTPGFDLAITPEQITVSASGDMALDRGTYKLSVAPEGTAQTDTGKYVVVWRKIDGEWKAAADIFNSDLAPSAG